MKRAQRTAHHSRSTFELGDKRGIAMALESLGHVAHAQAADDRAALLSKESLALAEAIGDRAGIARCLEGLATVASAENQPERVDRLLVAGTALRAALGAPPPPIQRYEYERSMAAMRADRRCGVCYTGGRWAGIVIGASRRLCLEVRSADRLRRCRSGGMVLSLDRFNRVALTDPRAEPLSSHRTPDRQGSRSHRAVPTWRFRRGEKRRAQHKRDFEAPTPLSSRRSG